MKAYALTIILIILLIWCIDKIYARPLQYLTLGKVLCSKFGKVLCALMLVYLCDTQLCYAILYVDQI